MPWWDDLWLNESFATWMAHRVVHEIHPEYQQDLALLQQVHAAMNADSLDSARSIRQPIASGPISTRRSRWPKASSAERLPLSTT